MKQQIHYLFMLLLMLLTGVGGVKAETTYKLEKVTEVEAGGLYVFEQSGYVMTTVSNKVLLITKTYKTTGLEGSENYVFTLESATASDKETPGFKMKNMSLSSNQYIGNSSKTDMTATNSSSAAVWAFNFQEEKVLIQNLNNSNRFLGLNQALDKNPTGYKAYATSNMSANPHDIVVFKLVEESSLPSAGLAFAENSYTVTYGESFTAPTLTNPNNLQVTYASSNTDVATVDPTTGAVTLVGAGTTTITASSEETETYAAGSASYELTVKKAPVVYEGNYFVKVTSTSDLTDGAYLIVYEDGQVAFNGGLETLDATSNTIPVTIDGNGIKATDASKAALFVWDNVAKTLQSVSGYYIGKTANSNGLDSSTKTAYTNTISIADDGYAVITASGNCTLRYNKASDQNRFRYFKSGQEPIALYKLTTLTPKVSPELSFGETTEFNINLGDEFTAPTLTTAEGFGGTVTYSSDNPEVATVNAAGEVEIKGVGTAVITAASAETEHFTSGTASYTIKVVKVYSAISDFKALEVGTVGLLNLTDAQIVYVDKEKKTIYVRDNSGAIALYNNDGFETELKAGDILEGTIEGKYSPFKNLPEITNIVNINALTSNTNETVVPKEIAATKEAIGKSVCNLVKITKTQIAEDNSKYFVGTDVQLYDKFGAGYSVETAKNVDVIGVATIFDATYEISPRTADDIVYYPAAPTFSPVAGEVEKGTPVTIAVEEGATIKYTVNGEEKTSDDNSVEVPVTEDTEITAVAVKNGLESDPVTANYSIPRVAEVGGNAYLTFEEALENATEDDIITLLADVAEPYTLPVGKTLKLKLNGHIITVNAPEGYVTNASEVDGITTYTTVLSAPQAYAVISSDKSSVTFYYDVNKPVGAIELGDGKDKSSNWTGETLTTATFDSSFKDYDGLTYLNGWFKDSPNLTTVSGLDNLNTVNVTSMVSMFNGCESLQAPLNFSNFNTENVTTMANMFYQCEALTNLDLSKFNTSKVTDMAHMFYGCTSLTELDLSTFNTANVTNMSYMFASCSALTIYVGEDWSTEKVTDDEVLFSQSRALVGGAGTKYDGVNLSVDYAHVDGGAANPGYLSSKTAPAAPTFSVEAGTYNAEQTVTITAAEGATIYYTTNDTELSAQNAEQKYTEPITISETTTLKAIAVKGAVSEVAEAAYTIEIPEPVTLTAPIIFHDGGVYEDALTVAMAGEGTIKYTLNGGAEQTYTDPITIDATTTVKAWTEQDGAKSDEVSKTFTIEAKAKGAVVEDGYYTIKNNGNGKYVNVAGRKTVTFVDKAATASAAGTVIKVKAEADGVKVLRSQGVDIPGYADKAMRYVPEIVRLVADKLHAEGTGAILGENGLDKIMEKFYASFDEHLYLEQAGENSYRIYGRTPSMKHVVDFYAENKANVDAKLPQLEQFINDAIKKVLQKTNGSGQSILVPFSLKTVWENMGKTLTEPVDEASTARFYEEVLSSETNVWNFAYETVMIYWTKLKDHPKFKENLDKLGDYAKYINKVENIRPNFKYFIVQKNGEMDIISEGNGDIVANSANTIWTLEDRTEFSVAFNEENVLNNKYYTTLYTDFAYTLPEGEGVKAYKVTEVSKAGVAKKVEMEGTIPAQTPVLLESESAEAQTLMLSTEDGTAPTDNLLVGADALIKQYQIKTAQVESLFELAKSVMGEEFYNQYVKEDYEHLMMRNAGTVNNKYFFGLSQNDMKGMENVRMLNLNDVGENLGFYSNWVSLEANKALIIDSNDPVKLMLKGDVNRSGDVTVADVNALVEIVLGKVIEPDDTHDFDAAHVNADEDITIADVTALVNIILGK